MNNSDNHFVAIGSDAKVRPEDERTLEGIFDRDEEAQEPADLFEDEFGHKHVVTHPAKRHSTQQEAIWDSLTDDDPE